MVRNLKKIAGRRKKAAVKLCEVLKKTAGRARQVKRANPDGPASDSAGSSSSPGLGGHWANLTKAWKGLDPSIRMAILGGGLGAAGGAGLSMLEDPEERDMPSYMLLGGLGGAGLFGGGSLAHRYLYGGDNVASERTRTDASWSGGALPSDMQEHVSQPGWKIKQIAESRGYSDEAIEKMLKEIKGPSVSLRYPDGYGVSNFLWDAAATVAPPIAAQDFLWQSASENPHGPTLPGMSAALDQVTGFSSPIPVTSSDILSARRRGGTWQDGDIPLEIQPKMHFSSSKLKRYMQRLGYDPESVTRLLKRIKG